MAPAAAATAVALIVVCSSLLTSVHGLPAKQTCQSGVMKDIKTGNPSGCQNGTQFYAQSLDHASLNSSSDKCETFPQQFQILDDYFKPGGPIIFYQGAETPAISCIEYTSLLETAKALEGLAVSLEHRYFGISTPHGLNFTENQDWSTKSLAELTLSNVLLDSVTFIEWVKTSHPGAKDSKVLVYGGSYGGFLTSMLRIHYPDTFSAAVASSPGLKFTTSPQNPDIYAAGNWLNTLYLQRSAVAAEKIQNGFRELRNRMQSGYFSGLKEELDLCYLPNATDQYGTLSSNLLTAFYTAAQYNYGFPFENAPAYPLLHLVHDIENATQPLDALKFASRTANDQISATCNDWNPITRGNGNTIPFQWITCTYFPYLPAVFATSDTIFGQIPPDFKANNLNDAFCEEAFKIHALSGSGVQEKYGLSQRQLEATTRILFSEGLVDPVTTIGPSPFYAPSGKIDAAVMLFINGAGHGADLQLSSPADSEGLTSAKAFEIEWAREVLSWDLQSLVSRV